jgi:hypothetical protein
MDDVLRWEQMDNIKGLQMVRGLNGEPGNITRVGMKDWVVTPTVYGEMGNVDERELTKRRKLGSVNEKIDITDIIAQIQTQQLTRELARMAQICWTVATSGTYSVYNRDGQIVSSDSFPIQTYTCSPGWGTVLTATPLLDLRAMKLLARGHSVDFGSKATIYMNQGTANNVLGNQNAADLFGRRGMYGATLNSIKSDNAILMENGLPQIEVFDGGYIDDTGKFTLYIPNNKAVLSGLRPNGAPVGRYRRTFNAVSRGTGSYMVIKEYEDEVPPKITVQRGHSGGPVLYWPSSLVMINC